MTITEFLEARIAEDEAVAREATAGPWEDDVVNVTQGAGGYADVTPNEVECMSYCYGGSVRRMAAGDVAHIARHDPARVLAECAAKRAILELHHEVVWTEVWDIREYGCNVCGRPRNDDYPCATVEALAAVYADHPDYQQEWRI